MSNLTQQETRDQVSSGDYALSGHTWVAIGPAGAIGSIHSVAVEGSRDGYTFKLLTDDGFRSIYPSLEVAQSALYASLLPGSEWPEFREH